jgi:chorismate mutase
MSDFLDYQWSGGVRRALEGREKRAAEAEAAESESEEGTGNPIERLLASLATPAEEGQPEGGRGMLGGGEPFPDDASEEERRERRRMAVWSTEGGAWRGAATSLLFTFAVLNAARSKWTSYPLDRGALEAVGRGAESQAAAQTLISQPLSPAGLPPNIREELEAAGALPSAVKPAADAAPPVASAGDGAEAATEAAAAAAAPTAPTTAAVDPAARQQEIAAEMAQIDEALQKTADLAARQQEIAARLAQIDEQLQKPVVDPAVREQEIQARLAQIDEQLKEKPDTAPR